MIRTIASTKVTENERLLGMALLLVTASHLSAHMLPPRIVLPADADWRFVLADPVGAESTRFDDHSWRTLTLPHDWSIEGSVAAKNPAGSGGGYFPSGVGWYRKTFTAPASWKGRQVSLEFDGVSMDATVYLNGHKLGNHPYAYTSFRFDMTSGLDLAGPNVIAVRVDNSMQPNSRWYSGSGIYRHVRVVVTNPIHILPWGVFVTTSTAGSTSATVLVKAEVVNAQVKNTAAANDTTASGDVTIRTIVVGTSGTKWSAAAKNLAVPTGQQAESTQQIAINRPALWSPDSPHLYRAITTVSRNGRVLDQVETSFGIRSLAWSAEKGLLLNGVAIKLAGGSVHHDNGTLGAAAFDRAEERKVELLKAAGFNAVRTAHNPPSAAFLDACDRLGMLVVDEPFDVWTVSKRKFDYARLFHDWWQQDIDAMVIRDRNHPSIIMWGIGNEIPEVWTPEGAPLAKQIATHVRALDSTRPLTQAFPGATYGANADAAISNVDLAGYNYNLAQNEPEDHRRMPDRIMLTTESFQADAFEQWSLIHDHPFIVGEFVWTAMDYLGESGMGAWSYGEPKQAGQFDQMKKFLRGYMAKMGADGKNPMAGFQDGQPPSPITPGFPWHAAYCGDLDLTGFRKPSSYYRDILWNGADRVYATVRLPEPEGKKIIAVAWSVYPTLPSWTWPQLEGRSLMVEVYSSAERVRLLLNDKQIGEKPTGRDQAFKAEFQVQYAPGTLKALGLRGDRVVSESILQTTGNAVCLRLAADRTVLTADGQDLAFVTVEAVDEKGRVQMNSEQKVQFSASGETTIAAVGNGDGQSQVPYSSNVYSLFQGRALVVLRATRHNGQSTLTAKADGLQGSSIVIRSNSAKLAHEIQ